MFEINKETIIYIVAPPFQASGGPELLHQLCSSLIKNNLNAVMYYFDYNKIGENYINPVHPQFEKYETTYANEIEDNSKNILIVPERLTNPLIYFSNIQKCVWWLGANNYFWLEEIGENKYLRFLYHWFRYILRKPTPLMFSQIKKQKAVHLAQSWYAVSVLNRKGVKNVAYLSDYINESFIESTQKLINNNLCKENIIIYNPSRHTGFLKKISIYDKKLKFVPIKNMSLKEVKETMCKAKIYLDFGSHPGKDRMPREAVLCGCCVITSTLGSAGFFDDIPILSDFKFDRETKNIYKIIQKIKYIFDNYEECYLMFDTYRERIIKEKEVFEKDINKIFVIKEKYD